MRQSLAIALALVAAAGLKAAVPIVPAGTILHKWLLSSSFQVVTLLLYVLARWQSGAND